MRGAGRKLNMACSALRAEWTEDGVLGRNSPRHSSPIPGPIWLPDGIPNTEAGAGQLGGWRLGSSLARTTSKLYCSGGRDSAVTRPQRGAGRISHHQKMNQGPNKSHFADHARQMQHCTVTVTALHHRCNSTARQAQPPSAGGHWLPVGGAQNALIVGASLLPRRSRQPGGGPRTN